MSVNPEEPFTVPLATLTAETKPLRMIWVSSGSFLMGVPTSDMEATRESPQFEVTFTHGFWLGQFPVTQAQWQVVMGSNPTTFEQICPDCPADNISWYQAMEFCDKLNRMSVLDMPAGFSFTLPTEAQWEYACRAGTQTRYYNGDNDEALSEIAWHEDNSSGRTHPVGEKLPNAWGFYDMLGNISEWCSDSPSKYPTQSVTNWVGKGNEFSRNVRSGSWKTTPTSDLFRCAYHGYTDPNAARGWFGFRLCLAYND